MKAKKLAEILLKNPDMEIMILDGFNGGGELRTINLLPYPRLVTQKDLDQSSDCDGLVGETVLRMGYGFY